MERVCDRRSSHSASEWRVLRLVLCRQPRSDFQTRDAGATQDCRTVRTRYDSTEMHWLCQSPAAVTRSTLARRFFAMWGRFPASITAALIAGACDETVTHGASAKSGTEVNQHQVLPVLMQHCWVCHGPVVQEVSLDLR